MFVKEILTGEKQTPHKYFNTGDPGAPEQIKDRNGQVVLALCKVCGQAEGELAFSCPGPKAATPVEPPPAPPGPPVRKTRFV